MSELIHQTADILIPQILEEGILYKRRSEGMFDHPETNMLNKAIMAYRPNYIELDREKCVFFSFKRDYIRFGHKENGIIVNSDDLEQGKLYVFSNSICGAIMRSIKNESLDLKEHVDTYWKTMIPFQDYDENYREIEQSWREMCKNQGCTQTEFAPEVLYFGNVPAQFVSLWTSPH